MTSPHQESNETNHADHDGLAHVMSVKLLFVVFSLLIFLTIVKWYSLKFLWGPGKCGCL